MSDDPVTARLGSYLAIGFGAQLACHLLGVGVSGGRTRIEWVHPVLVGLSVLLARGARPARTLLLATTWVFFLLASLLVVIAVAAASVLGMVLSGTALALAGLQMVALAFTVPDAGVAGGLPEDWRPWATSQWLHLSILLGALVAAVTAA